ncbi:type II secretion system F family protein [bacterium]|nr:type II secretion system F family protein [bacterium]NBX82294.1 type II secretion system F family protein [bacterium]
MSLLALVALVLTGGSAFFLGWDLFSGEIEGAAAGQLEQRKKKSKNGLLNLSRKMFRPLVMPYSQRIQAENWRKKNKRQIISAGMEDEIDVDELLAYKIFLGLVVPPVLYIWFFSQGFRPSLFMFLFMGITLYMYPSFWISGLRKKRQEEIKLQLPFVIDLMTLSTEAGLDFIGAIQKVVEKTRPGPLVDELERMLQQTQLGTSRADAMRELAWRIDLTEVSSLIAVLVTADEMGGSIGAVLRVQADLIRTQRFTSAEKKGAAASQKLLFPLILFIMPAVFIMIFGPVILGFIGAK